MAILPKITATKFTNNGGPLGTFKGKQIIGVKTDNYTMTQTLVYDDGTTETLTAESQVNINYPTTTFTGLGGYSQTIPSGPPSVTINGPIQAGAGWGTPTGYTSAQGYRPYQMTFDEVMKEAPKPMTHREILDIELSKLNVPFSAIELLETFDPGNGKDLNNPVYGFACEYCALVVEGFHNIHFTAKAFANHWKTCDER